MNPFKKVSMRFSVGLTSLLYGQGSMAGLLPKFKGADGLTGGTTDGMDLLAGYVTKGMAILVFIVAVVSIIYGVETCMHGVKEGQKNEASLGVLARYIVMGIIGVVLGLSLCYLAWFILAGFDINTIEV